MLVQLSPELYQGWVNNGSQGQYVQAMPGSTTVWLQQSGATLNGIPMQPTDFFTLTIWVEPTAVEGQPRPQLDVYYLSIKQFAELSGADSGTGDLRLVGGQLIQIKTDFPSSPIYSG